MLISHEEFLEDENRRRVAAFGYHAGKIPGQRLKDAHLPGMAHPSYGWNFSHDRFPRCRLIQDLFRLRWRGPGLGKLGMATSARRHATSRQETLQYTE